MAIWFWFRMDSTSGTIWFWPDSKINNPVHPYRKLRDRMATNMTQEKCLLTVLPFSTDQLKQWLLIMIYCS